MPNLIGEGFSDYVVKQIQQRELQYGKVSRSERVLAYQQGKTAFVRLVSGIDIKDPAFLNGTVWQGKGYAGNTLAKKLVLFNGTYDASVETQRSGIDRTGDPMNNNAYGLGGLEFGPRPMPGITSVDITSGPRGSLRFADIKIKAWNRGQFEAIDALYLRLGFTMLLEWGHSNFFYNDGTYEENNPYSLQDAFLAGTGLNQFEVLKRLRELRQKSNGNYDALYGKVSNFSWSYSKDGSIDISLKLVSMGDVIESLKLNSLSTPVTLSTGSATPPPAATTTDPPQTPTSAQVIQSHSAKHDIGAMLNSCKEQLDNFGKDVGGGVVVKSFNTEDGAEITDVMKQTWEGKDATYYIRLGTLLQWYEVRKMIVFKDNNPMIKFDYETKSNVVFFAFGQRSTDPRICLLSLPYATATGTIYEYGRGGSPYVKTSAGPGYLMNVYLNFEFILTTIDSQIDSEGRVNLLDFLEKLCTGICDATGNINKLSVSVDEEENVIRIIDEVKLPGRDQWIKDNLPERSTTLAKFTLYGFREDTTPDLKGTTTRGSFVSDFSIQTELSKETAAMIAIGAQASGQVIGEDATAFSAWSRGLQNRIEFEGKDPALTNKDTGSYDATFATTVTNYNTFLWKLGSTGGSLPTWNETDIDSFNSFQKTYLNWKVGENARTKKVASNTIGFLPINLSLTMEGLSGMKVYQKFAVDSSFLPANYSTSLEFINKSISHNVQGSKWTTKIESLVVPNEIPNTGEMDFAKSQGVDRQEARGTVTTSNTVKSNSNKVPESKRSIVTDIIKYAKSKGINDKNRMTCLIAVPWAETTLDYTQAEGTLRYSFEGAKKVFAKSIKNKKITDEQLRQMVAEKPQKTLYDTLYQGGGWQYRGRGLTQCTFKTGYQSLTNALKKNGENVDLVTNPDLIRTDRTLAIKAMVVGKIEGTFGKPLSTSRDYLNNFMNVFQTQNGGKNACMSVYDDYKRGWQGVKDTKWIQDLFNQEGLV